MKHTFECNQFFFLEKSRSNLKVWRHVFARFTLTIELDLDGISHLWVERLGRVVFELECNRLVVRTKGPVVYFRDDLRYSCQVGLTRANQLKLLRTLNRYRVPLQMRSGRDQHLQGPSSMLPMSIDYFETSELPSYGGMSPAP